MKGIDELIALKNLAGSADTSSDAFKKLEKATSEFKQNIDNFKITLKLLENSTDPKIASAIARDINDLDVVLKNIDNPAALKSLVNNTRDDFAVKTLLKNFDKNLKLGKLDIVDDTGKTLNPSQAQKFMDDLVDASKDSWTWMKNNPKKAATVILVGGSAITIAAVLGEAQKEADEINNTEFTIISIKKDVDEKDPTKEKNTIIEFTPKQVLVKGDSIIISQSNSIPNIDGQQSPKMFNLLGVTQIEQQIEQDGNFGTFRIKTSFENRAKDKAESIGKSIGGVAGGATGGALNAVFGALGLPNLNDTVMYISIGLLVLCLLSSLLASVILVMRYGD